MVCFLRNKNAGDFGFHGRWALLISDSRKQIISFSTLKGLVTGFAVIPFLPCENLPQGRNLPFFPLSVYHKTELVKLPEVTGFVCLHHLVLITQVKAVVIPGLPIINLRVLGSVSVPHNVT